MIRRLVKAVLGRLGIRLVRPQDLRALERDLEERINQTDVNLAALVHYTAPRLSKECYEVPGSAFRCYFCEKHAQRCQCPAGCLGLATKPSTLCGACDPHCRHRLRTP